jgi:hypothetical protein
MRWALVLAPNLATTSARRLPELNPTEDRL